jgi:hypothetical protein
MTRLAATILVLLEEDDPSFRINPSYLEGDFTGGGKMDVAVWYKNARPESLGLRSFMARPER